MWHYFVWHFLNYRSHRTICVIIIGGKFIFNIQCTRIVTQMNLLNQTPFESGSKLVDSMLKKCHKYVISQTSVQVMEKNIEPMTKKNDRSLSCVKTFIALGHIKSCISVFFPDFAFNVFSLSFRLELRRCWRLYKYLYSFFSVAKSVKNVFALVGCGKIQKESSYRHGKYFTTIWCGCVRKLWDHKFEIIIRNFSVILFGSQ